MALRVSKCCCCCSLKYGFLTFAILSLVYRVCAALSFSYLGQGVISFGSDSSVSRPSHSSNPFGLYPSNSGSSSVKTEINLAPGVGSFVGWYAVTAAILVLAIFGILHKRAIYLYPYIVILIIEIIVMVVVSIILAIVVSPFALINLLIAGSINTYAIICMISLYHNIKDQERSFRQLSFEAVPLKTV